jgi:Amt family ammonium transporter
MAWIFERKPKFVGLLTGAVAGLATITPCAGYVTVTDSVLIGCAAGIVCFAAITFKNRRGWDDALDVWGVHGVGGILGTICLGLLAKKAVNPSGSDGFLVGGDPVFFLKETVAVLGASAYAFVFSYVMLWVIDKVIPVRATEEQEGAGLDAALHGEKAYFDN